MNALSLSPRCDICHDDKYEVPASRFDHHGCNWCQACLDAVETMRTTSPAFNAIVERAIGLDVMRAFRRDLWLHDRNAMTKHPYVPFLWAIGDSGTTMVYPTGHTSCKPWTHTSAESMATALLQNSRPHMFVWNGKTLRPVDTTRAAYFLMTGK